MTRPALLCRQNLKNLLWIWQRALAELKAIRAILYSPALEESRRQEQQAKEKVERDAVENFALVSEDLNELLAREAEEEARNAEAQEEVQEQHKKKSRRLIRTDLGAIGVDSEDFLQPSPKIGDMKIASEEKSEEIQKEEKPRWIRRTWLCRLCPVSVRALRSA